MRQPIFNGALVSDELQRQLGLITVSDGCSGTLLNRYWVLTARHCVTTTGQITAALLQPDQVSIRAAWAPGGAASPTRLHELSVNTGASGVRRDIILVYLGAGDLGEVDAQRLYIEPVWMIASTPANWIGKRLTPSDTVTQYGRGFFDFASGVFGTATAAQSAGAGPYRSAQFTSPDITSITGTGYDLAMNAANQVGHGGDSGGPTVVTSSGVVVGIAGVQSSCSPTGYLIGAPARWAWATGISACQYVSVEELVQEIGWTIQESPQCQWAPQCVLPTIVRYVLH